LVADLEKKADTVTRVCEPILSKPPPKPEPKAPEPAAEKGDETAMETEVADEEPTEGDENMQE